MYLQTKTMCRGRSSTLLRLIGNHSQMCLGKKRQGLRVLQGSPANLDIFETHVHIISKHSASLWRNVLYFPPILLSGGVLTEMKYKSILSTVSRSLRWGEYVLTVTDDRTRLLGPAYRCPPASCHITPSLPPPSRFTLSVQVSQTDRWGIIGWCEENNNRYFHLNTSVGEVKKKKKEASMTIKTERKMKNYEPTFICPRIFLSTWTSSSLLGVILKTWSLQKKTKKNRAPLSVSLQQGSKCLKGVYYSAKIHHHSAGIHFQISKTFGSMKSQVMKPPFVLIEGDTYNSRRLMLKWVVPRSYRWQGQTPVRQSARGVILGLCFIGGTWNCSLADTVAEAVSHSDTVDTSTAEDVSCLRVALIHRKWITRECNTATWRLKYRTRCFTGHPLLFMWVKFRTRWSFKWGENFQSLFTHSRSDWKVRWSFVVCAQNIVGASQERSVASFL